MCAGAGTSVSSRFSVNDLANGFPMPVRCPCFCFDFVELRDRVLDACAFVSSLLCVAGRMWKTNLRSSWRNLSPILGQQSARNFLFCIVFFFHFGLAVVFDRWPAHMNIRVPRRACPAKGLQACPRRRSRRAQGRRRIPLLLHVFTLLHWL